MVEKVRVASAHPLDLRCGLLPADPFPQLDLLLAKRARTFNPQKPSDCGKWLLVSPMTIAPGTGTRDWNEFHFLVHYPVTHGKTNPQPCTRILSSL